MPIAYPQVLELKSGDVPFAWTERETLLYALGVGLWCDPMDTQKLPFVFERELKAVPILASVVAWGESPGAIGADPLLVVDGERDITFHQPMQTAGEITAGSRVRVRQGPWPGRGDRDRDRAPDRAPGLFSLRTRRRRLRRSIAWPARAASHARSGAGPLDRHRNPSGPGAAISAVRRPQPAARRSEFARRAGFPRPILHGMCTYGITCRAVLQTYADYDPTRFRRHAARFSAPVFPGETLTVDLWRDGDEISFEARVKSRDVVVIRNGLSVLGGFA